MHLQQAQQHLPLGMQPLAGQGPAPLPAGMQQHHLTWQQPQADVSIRNQVFKLMCVALAQVLCWLLHASE